LPFECVLCQSNIAIYTRRQNFDFVSKVFNLFVEANNTEFESLALFFKKIESVNEKQGIGNHGRVKEIIFEMTLCLLFCIL